MQPENPFAHTKAIVRKRLYPFVNSFKSGQIGPIWLGQTFATDNPSLSVFHELGKRSSRPSLPWVNHHMTDRASVLVVVAHPHGLDGIDRDQAGLLRCRIKGIPPVLSHPDLGNILERPEGGAERADMSAVVGA